MLMLLKVALVGVLPSSDGCEGCSCACGAVLGRGDEFLGDMMSCLEISAARGVLTGRKAAAMMGAARASEECLSTVVTERRQMCKLVHGAVPSRDAGRRGGCRRRRSNADGLRKRPGYGVSAGTVRAERQSEVGEAATSIRRGTNRT